MTVKNKNRVQSVDAFDIIPNVITQTPSRCTQSA